MKKRILRMALVALGLFILSCQTIENVADEFGIQSQGDQGDLLMGPEDALSTFGEEDVRADLSDYCNSLLPMGIFTQEPHAYGRIYLVEKTPVDRGGPVQCLFEWDGPGVWCEWQLDFNVHHVPGCIMTPDPQRNKPEEECVGYDHITAAFCGEYDGVSMTGITRGVGSSIRYAQSGSTGQFAEDKQSTEITGVMSCNKMADGDCLGTWTLGGMYGEWMLEMP